MHNAGHFGAGTPCSAPDSGPLWDTHFKVAINRAVEWWAKGQWWWEVHLAAQGLEQPITRRTDDCSILEAQSSANRLHWESQLERAQGRQWGGSVRRGVRRLNRPVCPRLGRLCHCKPLMFVQLAFEPLFNFWTPSLPLSAPSILHFNSERTGLCLRSALCEFVEQTATLTA